MLTHLGVMIHRRYHFIVGQFVVGNGEKKMKSHGILLCEVKEQKVC
jgi:hypothetical protein